MSDPTGNQQYTGEYNGYYNNSLPSNADTYAMQNSPSISNTNMNMSNVNQQPRLHLAPKGTPKSKNHIKLTIVPTDSALSNNSYGNLGSLRNTPLTPSSALTLGHMNFSGHGGFSNNSNNIYYNQAVQPPSNNDLLSPIHSQLPQASHLYNHHHRSSSSHLSGYSPFYNENASPITSNFPPLPMHIQNRNPLVTKNSPHSTVFTQDTNSSVALSGPPSANSTVVMNNATWYNTDQSPSIKSPVRNVHKLMSNNSMFQFSPLPQDTSQQSPIVLNDAIPQRVYNSQLPTHYEDQAYYSLDQSRQQPQPYLQQEQFIPPLRAAAPGPYFADSSVALNSGALSTNGHRRGQSLGNILTKGIQYTPVHDIPPLPRPQVINQNSPRLEAPVIKAINSRDELTPVTNHISKYRRASLGSKQVSPLKALTTSITTSYSLCRPEFNYQLSRNPRRVLTKPSEPKMNHNCDNVDSDYILYVNDVLGVEESRKYLVLDILGQGTFGQVVKCQNLINKEILAVKVIKSNPAYMNQSITEVAILETINNKIDPLDKHHFLRIKDRFMHKRHLCIALELLSNNLYELIKQNQFNGLDMGLIKSFSRQLLSSLIVLKTFKIIHCDLKPENILLVSPDKPDLKIIDFGSACYERQTVYTYIQSRFYRSPEVILGLPYTCAIDMWSFGCIVAELFLGLPLLPGSSEYNQITRIIDLLGYPASWMIEMGKNSLTYVEKMPAYPSSSAFKNESLNSHQNNSTAFYKYQLKSIEKYSKEYKVTEKPSKNYFNSNDLKEIITNYTPKNKNPEVKPADPPKKLTEGLLNDRLNLHHFLGGILNINPLERWTPQQAIAHPFVNNLPYNANWTPPGIPTNKSNYPGSPHGRLRHANIHRRGQLSTSAIGSSGKYNNNGMFLNNDMYAKTDLNIRQRQGEQPKYRSNYTMPTNNDNINSFKFPL